MKKVVVVFDSDKSQAIKNVSAVLEKNFASALLCYFHFFFPLYIKNVPHPRDPSCIQAFERLL